MEFYKNITTDEIVYKEEAEHYVLNELGITIKPKGKDGEMTQEQIEYIETTTEWFFSGNWIEDKLVEKEDMDVFQLINEECELDEAREREAV